jgi:hypothetical protein
MTKAFLSILLVGCGSQVVDSFTVNGPSPVTTLSRRVPSNNFDNAFWSPARSTRTSLQVVAPLDFLPAYTLADSLTSMTEVQAEALAGPLFGASLFPYLAFLYLLNLEENDCPKGVTVGFATCLLFVFLTIPAAIVAKLWYGASLADSDWLHGSAESLLTITNLVTVVAFRQALQAKQGVDATSMPPSATSYSPMIWWVGILTAIAAVTAFVPGLTGAEQHTPYLNGFLDVTNVDLTLWGAHAEPDNALTIATWIIHISSLVEFLVAMGFCWRWADVVKNPTWKGLTWGLIPLHSSGITACTYHLFYNHIPVLVPLQAFLTCIGNTTAAYATLRIALSNGWKLPESAAFLERIATVKKPLVVAANDQTDISQETSEVYQESASLVGFEDLGDALQSDNDYTFLVKLFVGCAVASYAIKYGELCFDFPFEANTYLGFTVVLVPSMLNGFKWWKRSQDPSFEGWF